MFNKRHVALLLTILLTMTLGAVGCASRMALRNCSSMGSPYVEYRSANRIAKALSQSKQPGEYTFADMQPSSIFSDRNDPDISRILLCSDAKPQMDTVEEDKTKMCLMRRTDLLRNISLIVGKYKDDQEIPIELRVNIFPVWKSFIYAYSTCIAKGSERFDLAQIKEKYNKDKTGTVQKTGIEYPAEDTPDKISPLATSLENRVKSNPSDRESAEVLAILLVDLNMPDEAISYLRNASRTAKSSGNPVDAIRHLMHAGDVIYFLDCLQDESSEKIQQNCNEALDLYREAQNIALDFDRKSTLISAALSDIHFRIAITAERLMMGKQFVFDHLKEAVSLDSENIEARYQLASYYFSVEKNLPTAFQNFKMITVQYPNHAAAFYQSCLISAADKKFTEAISLCEKALEVDPNLALAYDLLSDIYIALMQLDEAVKYAEKSLKLFPSFEAFEWRMGLIYFSRKEFEKAAALFEKSAQSKTPSEATLFYLAESLYELKNYPKARKIYEDLLERRVEASKAIPNQNQYMLELIQPLYLRIGICAIMMKDYQAAEDFFEKASAQDISNPQLHYYLAKIYYEKKDMRRAFAATEEALKLKPDYLDAKGFLALLYHEEKNYPEAEKVILEVLQKDPDNLNWQNTYAIILAGSRKFKEALDVLNKIITKDQGFYVAYYNVACVHSLKKSKKEALEWLEKSFQKGFNEWDHIKTDTDLDYIRNDPRFIQLIEKYKKIAEEKEKESKKNE